MYDFDLNEVLAFIDTKKDYLTTAEKLYDIYNGNLSKYLEEKIDMDIESPNSRKECKSRLSPINILPKIVNKLSGVYRIQPERDGLSPQLEEKITQMKFDSSMNLVNKYLNLFRIVAIEPVTEIDDKGVSVKGTLSFFRVYPAHKFLLMDDGTIDGNVLGFIKIIGKAKKDVYNQKKRKFEEYNVDVYQMYTDTEYITFDNYEITERIQHDFGRIPITTLKRDCDMVMPFEDKDTYAMVILLPLLMSDMNYALKYKCFSVLYTIGLSAPKGGLSPNSILQFDPTSVDPSGGGTGQLAQISPTVAVTEMLDAIYSQYSLWLESRSIKMRSMGKGDFADNASGIAKAIDQADVTDDIINQRQIMSEAEQDLFQLIGRFLGEEIKVSTTFIEMSILPEDNKDKIDRIVIMKNEQLLSWEEAVKQANPQMTESQLKEMMDQILLKSKLESQQEEKENGMGGNSNNNKNTEETRQEISE